MGITPFMARHLYCVFTNMVSANELVLFWLSRLHRKLFQALG